MNESVQNFCDFYYKSKVRVKESKIVVRKKCVFICIVLYSVLYICSRIKKGEGQRVPSSLFSAV
jgi:hypothetical protein